MKNDPEGAIPTDACGAVCVLASGSKGNCAVLVVPKTSTTARRVLLFDAGLSPSRTARLLNERGIRPDEVDEIIFTHLDSDHCHSGWVKAIRPGSQTGAWRATLRIHRMHMGRAERMGLLYSKTEPFDERFSPANGIEIRSLILAHDDLGVAVFRGEIRLPDRTHGSFGYATDLGHIHNGLIEHLSGVDTLAIESNYCPVLQESSGRPAFLKHRIMGGAGHLSNEESAMAVSRISPRQQLILLHLSQECNEPAIAMGHHRRFVEQDDDRECVVSLQQEATPWIPIQGGEHSGSLEIHTKHKQVGLFHQNQSISAKQSRDQL
ncbi:MAG: MBL fold metallo-hydrolase [Phycisphaerales bacterium]|nr:MBL fold metallo-hydrolase [Phycisphaerales bacterium]